MNFGTFCLVCEPEMIYELFMKFWNFLACLHVSEPEIIYEFFYELLAISGCAGPFLFVCLSLVINNPEIYLFVMCGLGTCCFRRVTIGL